MAGQAQVLPKGGEKNGMRRLVGVQGLRLVEHTTRVARPRIAIAVVIVIAAAVAIASLYCVWICIHSGWCSLCLIEHGYCQAFCAN